MSPRTRYSKIDRSKVRALLSSEERRFAKDHPKSKALYERAKAVLLAGVPMNWMIRWAGSFPVFVEQGKGARIIDVDGNEYVDFCLGDTGSMFGHSPKDVVDAVTRQVRKGITMMLPTEDSVWVGEELGRRFGLPQWQIVMTATDANRYSIKLARMATGRTKILVVSGCYHGSVDETLVSVDRKGRTIPREGNICAPVHPSLTTRAVQFNDVPALTRELAHKDVACVLAEPAMTNHGIVLPDPGYHEQLRRLTRKTGTLLIMDETHTLSCGIGGYTRQYRLHPDMITMGKPLAGGVPVAAYGISKEVSDMVYERILDDEDETGIGGTLSGNALAVAAMKATLEKVYTQKNFDLMLPLAKRFSEGVKHAIVEQRVPWHVTRLGIRTEYGFSPNPPRNAAEVDAHKDPELEKLMHLMALNRGVLLTPFHNMALVCPYTTRKDVDLHTAVFTGSVESILA